MKTRFHAQRGSIILVTMIFVVALGLIMAKYLDLAQQSAKISNINYHHTAAMNVAEYGLDDGMWSLNQYISGVTTAFSTGGWGPGTEANTVTKTISNDLNLGSNTSGKLKILVKNYNVSGKAPTIVTRAQLTLPDNITVEKWVEIDLVRRSRFASGLVAKKSISFTGNTTSVDSWDSKSDINPYTATAYDPSIAHDKGSVGSIAINSTIDVQNADIYGTAAIGGQDINAIQVGAQGRVGPYGTPAGEKPGASTDFSANLDTITQPSLASGTSISTQAIFDSLPTATTTIDGQSVTVRYANNIDIKNKETITATGNVILVLTASPGTSAITVGGQAQLIVGTTTLPNSSLKIYTEGNIDIAGGGMTNATNAPINFAIYGTGTSSQSIKLVGNGDKISAVVYAPNAALELKGNGTIAGSFVADTVVLSGTPAFHYDESLSRTAGAGGFKINFWHELVTGEERKGYNTAMAF